MQIELSLLCQVAIQSLPTVLKVLILQSVMLKKQEYDSMPSNWFKDLVERHAFGVCQYLGERMQVAPAEVRKYFIYTSFIGMGSPLIVYLFVAFWMNVRRYIRRGRNEIYN